MNTHDGLKTPFPSSLNKVALQRAADAIQSLGRELPCHVVSIEGQIVTVSFDLITDLTLPNVTIPIATSIYDWLPIQPGDRGVTRAADAYIGGVSGLGGGTARLDQRPANLSALVFAPVSNASWASEFQNFRVVQAPDGVVIQDLGGACVFKLTPSGIEITGSVTISQNLTVDGDTSFGGGAKKVVLDGDPVISGTVRASSTTIKAT